MNYFINFSLYSLDMSEADLIYSETLMQRGKECYEGKEIVILGGGDGGLLWELLKENPKHVTMLEVNLKLILSLKPIIIINKIY
jgi:spermidine synthase